MNPEQPPVHFKATADFSLLQTAFSRTRAFMADLEHIFSDGQHPAGPDRLLPPLIGIGGPKEHGKDALADYLVEDWHYQKTFMSEPLTAAVSLIGPRGPWVRLDAPVFRGLQMVYEQGDFMRYADLVEAVGYTAAKQHRDAREYLQGLGTEVGRNMLGENVWIDIAAEKIRAARAAGHAVVITGIRYQNEIDLVRELGGHTVWIERPQASLKAPEPHPLTDAIDEALGIKVDPTATHSSETSLQAEDFDIFIDNDRDLPHLRTLAEKLHEEIADGLWDRA